MSSCANHQVLAGLILGRSTDYRDTYDASLLQGVPRSLNRDPLDLEAGDLPFHGTGIWTLYEFPQLNAKGSLQVAIGHVRLGYTSVDLVESKSFKLYLNSFNQTHFNSWDEVHQTLEHNLSICVQGKVSMVLYRLNELEDRPIGHFNGVCIDNQDIAIDNYEFTVNYLENVASGGRVVGETPISHLLKSSCLTTHQPDWGSVQTQYRGRQVDREKLLHYLVSFRHHSGFHEQCAERTSNDLLRFCQPEKSGVYVRRTRRGGLDVNL